MHWNVRLLLNTYSSHFNMLKITYHKGLNAATTWTFYSPEIAPVICQPFNYDVRRCDKECLSLTERDCSRAVNIINQYSCSNYIKHWSLNYRLILNPVSRIGHLEMNATRSLQGAMENSTSSFCTCRIKFLSHLENFYKETNCLGNLQSGRSLHE